MIRRTLTAAVNLTGRAFLAALTRAFPSTPDHASGVNAGHGLAPDSPMPNGADDAPKKAKGLTNPAPLAFPYPTLAECPGIAAWAACHEQRRRDEAAWAAVGAVRG